ncbi:BtrH N-terminal domain-containing protein [Nonomuraea sp. NPDC052116]|uniref:BtrH N-terminal domain-containing protein n=1 Tax=Nonomuraea sp. NPDC052116 TaxID=3155665 RepID=UPI003444B49A
MPITRGPLEQWYRDPVSCLQSTLATLLLKAGEDPLVELGLDWEFRHIPGDVRPEEYYWPCRHPGDVVRSLLPHRAAVSRWRTVAGEDPLAVLEDALAAGLLPVIAVDNFHLPFRPAYHDVHAAHLLVVYEVDREAGTVGVSDAQPPAFLGPIPVADLLRSWDDASPHDDQDVFFSGKGETAARRWLEVRLDEPGPELDPGQLGTVLRANVRGFTNPAERDGTHQVGLEGLRGFTDDLVERSRDGGSEALVSAYTFGWGMQAQAALHGELLRRCGAGWGMRELAEAGRHAELVAHLWSGVRVQSAHGRADPAGCARELARHAALLVAAYERALETIDRVAEGL